MFKIGEFSKLTRVTVKVLRNYDELGLLIPSRIDKMTGYRYYTTSQIPRINRILALKGIGFSLAEIKEVLERELTAEQITSMLEEKRKEISKAISAEQMKISHINAYIKIIEQERGNMNYDFVVKSLPSINVVSLRGIVPGYGDQGILWQELYSHVSKQAVKLLDPCFAVYHDCGFKEKDIDIEVFYIVETLGQNTDRIRFQTLPPIPEAICVIHKGSYDTLSLAYQAASKWLEENHYHMAAEPRECQIKGPWDEPNPEEWITEIQFPVKRK